MKGQKRKQPADGLEGPDRTRSTWSGLEGPDRTRSTWESQRQLVFSVSLNKYQRGQELPEPSLRRSVLIANTLRQVSLEAWTAPPVDMEVSQPPAALQETLFTGVYLSNCASWSPASCHDEDWGSTSVDSDVSLSAAISSILTALDSVIDGSPQAAPRTPLRSLENLSGPNDGGVAWVKQGVRGYGGSWEQQDECSNLFQDIDTSLLERDMGVLGGGYQTGEDLLRFLPPFSYPPLSTRT